MKVKVYSDLHLEHYSACQVFPVGEGDVLILAGDILCARHFKTDGYIHSIYDNFLYECSKNYDKILYVFGNHEYYGYNVEGAKKKILSNLPSNFQVLDNDTVKIGVWNFIGFTLWTDFRNENVLEMMDAATVMNDYRSIRITSKYRKLNPDDTLDLHKKSKKYLLKQLQSLTENVFVISHHGPSLQSIASKYRNESNGAYVSDLDNLILAHPQIKYWVHGHTHSRFDYMIEGCRVICNPSGYTGESDSNGFDPDLLIDLP